MELCGSVPCELPREVVHDALALSVGSHSIALSFGLRDYKSGNHHVHEWPFLQMGTTSEADILETQLVVGFSYLQSTSPIFKAW